jgi:hypothetical protein
MQDLQKLVADSFSKIVLSGVIEQSIEKKLTETINSSIESELREYSDFGKAIKEQVKKSLQVDLSAMNLPSYGDMVLNIVRKTVKAATDASIAKHVEETLSQIFEAPPDEITVSKIVADFIEYSRNDGGCDCDVQEKISLHIENSRYGVRWVSMDKDANKSEYQCAYRFGVDNKDGKIIGLRIDEKEVENRLFVGKFYSFERNLFQMYTCGTKVVIDAEAYDIDTSYPGHD